MHDTIEREIVIQAPVGKVWNVLTTAEYIRQWYAFSGAEVDLRPGGKITFSWDEHGKYLGVIVAADPNRNFSFCFAPFDADTQPAKGNSTTVSFTLSAHNDTTIVHFTESGYQSLAYDDIEKKENYSTSAGAWDDSLDLLKEVAEK